MSRKEAEEEKNGSYKERNEDKIEKRIREDGNKY